MGVKFKQNVKEAFRPDIRKMEAGGSDSEGEGAVRAVRPGGEMLKWKDTYENKLEELLVKWEFDFEEVAKEFRSYLRREEPLTRYEVSERTLQVKWTDIEIKVVPITQKYRMKEIRSQEPEEALEEAEDMPEGMIECTNLEELD